MLSCEDSSKLKGSMTSFMPLLKRPEVKQITYCAPLSSATSMQQFTTTEKLVNVLASLTNLQALVLPSLSSRTPDMRQLVDGLTRLSALSRLTALTLNIFNNDHFRPEHLAKMAGTMNGLKMLNLTVVGGVEKKKAHYIEALPAEIKNSITSIRTSKAGADIFPSL